MRAMRRRHWLGLPRLRHVGPPYAATATLPHRPGRRPTPGLYQERVCHPMDGSLLTAEISSAIFTLLPSSIPPVSSA